MRQCQVPGCTRDADFEVFLYHYAGHPGQAEIRYKRDLSCPFICEQHAVENESGAQGERLPRGSVEYPYTNRGQDDGLTIYRPMETESAGMVWGRAEASHEWEGRNGGWWTPTQ